MTGTTTVDPADTSLALDVVSAAALPAADVCTRSASTPHGLTDAEVGRRRAALGPERGDVAPGPMPAGVVASAPLAPARAAGRRGDRVLLRRRTQRRGHHRRDRRCCRSGSASSTSTAPRRRPRRCTTRSTTRPSSSATARPASVDVTELVPGDIVELHLGDIVPADVRLLEASPVWSATSRCSPASRCPSDKYAAPVARRHCAGRADRLRADGHGRARRHAAAASSCRTGPHTEFGAIAAGLSTHQLDTEFQIGLRRFSTLLVYVAGALTTSIFVDQRRCCTVRSSTRCCSRWRSPSASPRSCCPPSCPPALPPVRAG